MQPAGSKFGFRISDRRSRQSAISDQQSAIGNHQSPITNHQSPIGNQQSAISNRTHAYSLPRWWRRTLVATATLLLCSCQLPTSSLEQLAELVEDATSPADLAYFIEDGAAPRSGAWGRAGTDAQHWSAEPPVRRRTGRSRAPSRMLGLLDPSHPFEAPVVIREIDPEVLEQSRPIELPTSSFRPTTLVSAGRENSDGTIGFGDVYLCDANRLVGPSDEYLCDGGDFGLPVGVRADWTVDGLEQEDAVAHYDTVDGRVVVTPSNRVCFYAPRFAAVRRVEGLAAHERRRLVDVKTLDTRLADAEETRPVATSTQRHAVAINLADRPPNLFRGREQPGGMGNLMASMEAVNSLSVYANLEIIRTGQVDGSQQAALRRAVLDAVSWSSDQAVQVVLENKHAVATLGLAQPGIVYQTSEPDSPKLRLVKLASTYHALPGEEVEFTLRFDNVGDQVIGNVTIIDNLATRLEYVPQSAKSSVEATFSAVPNGAGSAVLRWEITDPLEPGNGGILQFTSRVR